ncbi:MAG TPA: TraR/DksA C4-type zinc finger protein [Segeticoccus sp.]|nr:TraR/DksA C4-type zinc finger protein [Segeticoccus sp.]
MSEDALAQIRSELESEFTRLRAQVDEDERELTIEGKSVGIQTAGDDEADRGAKLSQHEQQASLASNAQLLLAQTAMALGRIEAGAYGTCTSCSAAIGTARLQAFPRVTTCLSCQHEAERRR